MHSVQPDALSALLPRSAGGHRLPEKAHSDLLGAQTGFQIKGKASFDGLQRALQLRNIQTGYIRLPLDTHGRAGTGLQGQDDCQIALQRALPAPACQDITRGLRQGGVLQQGQRILQTAVKGSLHMQA